MSRETGEFNIEKFLTFHSYVLGWSSKKTLTWIFYWLCAAHSLALFVCVAKWSIKIEVKNTATPDTHSAWQNRQVHASFFSSCYSCCIKITMTNSAKSPGWVIMNTEAKHRGKQKNILISKGQTMCYKSKDNKCWKAQRWLNSNMLIFWAGLLVFLHSSCQTVRKVFENVGGNTV